MLCNSTVELKGGDILQPNLQLGNANARMSVRDHAPSRSRVENSSVSPYPKKKPFQKEVDTLHALLVEKPDKEEYVGNILVTHLRGWHFSTERTDEARTASSCNKVHWYPRIMAHKICIEIRQFTIYHVRAILAILEWINNIIPTECVTVNILTAMPNSFQPYASKHALGQPTLSC